MAQHLTPFKQAGKTGWQIRWRERRSDGTTVRKQQGGFATRGEARAFGETVEKRLRLGGCFRPDLTLAGLFERYLAGHTGTEWTRKMLRWKLDKAEAVFGTLRASEITPEEIRRWRLTIPEGHRWEATQALKQALRWAEDAELIERSPAAKVKNPMPTRGEIRPFESWADIRAVAEELGEYGPIAVFAAGTGLRPGEWIALERRDLDLKATVAAVNVARRMTKDGVVVDATKNGKPRRVPLRPRVVAALEALPVRIDSKLVFPNRRGGYIDLHNWRQRDWAPALEAAGFTNEKDKADRGPYALRHTYATWALRAGIPTFTLARRMGTSLEMIEQTYGHLAVDADEWEIERLTAFDAEQDGRYVDAGEGRS
ncbi:MAG: tyrosine-type recombinase/integrase [Gaiellaceae bacterium]